MLSLVGLGLNDEKDLTLKGLEAAKKAKKVYIELYTGYWHGNLKKLEKIIGKKIFVLQRKDLEDNSEEILKEAKHIDVVVLVQGDPLVATTHNSLVLDARKMKVKIRIIHNASIVSAIAETGLHIYKFGQIVTIPFPEKTKDILPQSIYNIIARNRKAGLHTLCLLDVIADERKYMLPQEAVKILLDLEEKNGKKAFTEDNEVIAVGKLGSEKPVMEYKKFKDMINSKFRISPAILIIPGKVHFTEKEFLEKI